MGNASSAYLKNADAGSLLLSDRKFIAQWPEVYCSVAGSSELVGICDKPGLLEKESHLKLELAHSNPCLRLGGHCCDMSRIPRTSAPRSRKKRDRLNPYPEGSVFIKTGEVVHVANVVGENVFAKLDAFCVKHESDTDESKSSEWTPWISKLEKNNFAAEINGYYGTYIGKRTVPFFLGNKIVSKILIFKCIPKGIAVATFRHGSSFVSASANDVRAFLNAFVKDYTSLKVEYNDKSRLMSMVDKCVDVSRSTISAVSQYAYTTETSSPVIDFKESEMKVWVQ